MQSKFTKTNPQFFFSNGGARSRCAGPGSAFDYKINGILCLMGDDLCWGCLCVSQCFSVFLSLSLPLVDSLCEGNPNLRLPHDTECQLYYDCSAEEPPFFSPAEKYLRECKYPMLFSTKSMKCEDFESVVCSSRKEMKQMCKSIVLHFFLLWDTECTQFIYLVIKEFHIAILYFTICRKLVEIQI